MKIMKTLSIGGNTYEIYDAKARADIEALKKSGTGGGSGSGGSTGGGGVSSWNDLTDKPFYDETNTYSVAWDGNTDGLESASPTEGVILYKISDDILSVDDWDSVTVVITSSESSKTETVTSSSFMTQDGTDIWAVLFDDLMLYLSPIDGVTLTDTVTISSGVWIIKIIADDIAVDFTFSNSAFVPLDEKFIPDTIARVDDIPGLVQPNWEQNDETADDYIKNRTHWSENVDDALLFGPSEIVFSYSNDDSSIIYDQGEHLQFDWLNRGGLQCAVIWNGVEYAVESDYVDNLGIVDYYLGDPKIADFDYKDEGLPPFKIARRSRVSSDSVEYYIWTRGTQPSTITLEIYGPGVKYNKLDEKFIPDTIARKSDIVGGSGGGVTSWNDLTDRPFYEEGSGATIEWDGTIEGRDTMYFSSTDSYLYKVSDLTPSMSDLSDYSIVQYNPFNDTKKTYNSISFIDDETDNCINCLNIGSFAIVISNTEFSLYGTSYTAPSTGVYFTHSAGGGLGIYTQSMTWGDVVVHPLDDKFIPDTIARTADIPTDDHINELIDAKLAETALPSAEEVAF